jgi:hypothetical protein
MFEAVTDAGVVDAMTAAARAQNADCARELAASGELYGRRAPADDAERSCWAIDGHENVVAEVAAALGISRGRAAGRLRYAIALRERLPRVAAVFARGEIDFRLMAAVVYRTELVEDPDLIAKLDTAVARHAPRWTRPSGPKLVERIDMWVARFDPAALRVPGRRNEDRYVEIGPVDPGLAGVWAQLHATDGAALEQKLDALAATVCRADPRRTAQRRADALGALAAGLDVLGCQDVLFQGRRLGGSSGARRHRRVDIAHRTPVRHQTRWKPALSGSRRPNRRIGTAHVDAAAGRKPRPHDAGPTTNPGQDRAARISWERGINEARMAAEAARRAERIAASNEPPPF